MRFIRWIKSLFKKPTQQIGMDPTPQSTPASPDWSYIWQTVWLDKSAELAAQKVAEQIIANYKRYVEVQRITGVPWWFTAALHYRESSLNFAGCLHNGERILGTGKKTSLVPKGRGPFTNWEEAAVDALKLKNYHQYTDWSVPTAMARAERFNGLGYRKTGEYSPYVLAGTNWHDETGKYVRDGKYDSNAIEKQLGVVAIWLALRVKYLSTRE